MVDVLMAGGDREIVDAVLAGDTESFRRLVERELPSLLGICRRILRDPIEAEDAAQEALIQAYRALATFRGDGSFGAWLARIGVRVASARRFSRPAVEPLDDAVAERRSPGPDPAEDPEARLLDLERRRAILDAIRGLPPAQRRVVALRLFDDLSLEEIAAMTELPMGTVKSRLHRGLARVRDQLGARSSR